MLKLILTLFISWLLPLSACADDVHANSSPSLEAALAVVREATYAHPSVAMAVRQDVLALPPQGPEFAVRALEILLGNSVKWRSYREPREAVLQKISESLRLLGDSPGFFQSKVHERIGEKLHALFERFTAPSHRQRMVLQMMSVGDFWSARELPFLVRQIKAGKSMDFAVAILEVGRRLDRSGRTRLGNALHAMAVESPVEKSLLFLLGMSSADDQRDLIRLFEREFRMTDPLLRPHFPAGIFERRDEFQYSASSPGVIEWNSTMSPPGLFGAELVASLALQEIRLRYQAKDPNILHAIEALRSHAREAGPGPQGLDLNSLFYRRLTTTGFLSADGKSSSALQREWAGDSKVVEVDFISRRKTCIRLLK